MRVRLATWQDERAAHEQTRRELADSEERCRKLTASLAETVSLMYQLL